MSTNFSLELRSARKKAGLTQEDLAHLLGTGTTTVAALESGKQQPRIDQLIMLSLIYGRSFESFFAEIMKSARRLLRERMPGLPKQVRYTVHNLNRASTLEKLRERLTVDSQEYGPAP